MKIKKLTNLKKKSLLELKIVKPYGNFKAGDTITIEGVYSKKDLLILSKPVLTDLDYKHFIRAF